MDLDVKNSTSLPQSFMNTPGMLNIDNGNMMLMNGNYDLFSNINFENIMSDETFNNMIFSELNELPDFSIHCLQDLMSKIYNAGRGFEFTLE